MSRDLSIPFSMKQVDKSLCRYSHSLQSIAWLSGCKASNLALLTQFNSASKLQGACRAGHSINLSLKCQKKSSEMLNKNRDEKIGLNQQFNQNSGGRKTNGYQMHHRIKIILKVCQNSLRFSARIRLLTDRHSILMQVLVNLSSAHLFVFPGGPSRLPTSKPLVESFRFTVQSGGLQLLIATWRLATKTNSKKL